MTAGQALDQGVLAFAQGQDALPTRARSLARCPGRCGPGPPRPGRRPPQLRAARAAAPRRARRGRRRPPGCLDCHPARSKTLASAGRAPPCGRPPAPSTTARAVRQDARATTRPRRSRASSMPPSMLVRSTTGRTSRLAYRPRIDRIVRPPRCVKVVVVSQGCPALLRAPRRRPGAHLARWGGTRPGRRPRGPRVRASHRAMRRRSGGRPRHHDGARLTSALGAAKAGAIRTSSPVGPFATAVPRPGIPAVLLHLPRALRHDRITRSRRSDHSPSYAFTRPRSGRGAPACGRQSRWRLSVRTRTRAMSRSMRGCLDTSGWRLCASDVLEPDGQAREAWRPPGLRRGSGRSGRWGSAGWAPTRHRLRLSANRSANALAATGRGRLWQRAARGRGRAPPTAQPEASSDPL